MVWFVTGPVGNQQAGVPEVFVQGGQFRRIRTRTQFADMIDDVINSYDDIRHLSRGRTAY